MASPPYNFMLPLVSHSHEGYSLERERLDKFFEEISRRLKSPVRVYLTGGTVSYLWGGHRPPEGTTFGLHCSGSAVWDLQDEIDAASQSTGLPHKIKGMSGLLERVYLPDYKKGAKLMKRFGRLSVYLLDWKIWSIGKVSRGEAADLQDLKVVFQKLRPSPFEVLKVWEKAFSSGMTPLQHQSYVRSVEAFFQKFCQEIWGDHMNPKKVLTLFRRRAGEISRNFPQSFPIFSTLSAPPRPYGLGLESH